LRYVLARFRREQREEAYRFYVAEGIRFVSENTTHSAFDGGGRYLNLKLYDILYPPKQDTRTAEDIINHVKQGLAKLGGE
jgi:hypothetical protein